MKNRMDHKRKRSGFTLVELLIVIGVIAILASIAFVALNPLGRYRDARNARRWTDVNAILAAVKLQQLDNNGEYSTEVNDLTADLYYQIGTSENCNDTCDNPAIALQSDCIDLSSLVDAGYLPAVPIDPNDAGATEEATRYYLMKAGNGTLTVGSCSEETGANQTIPEIQVSR